METHKILAIAFVFIAISDVLVLQFLLKPQLCKKISTEELAILSPEEKQAREEKEKQFKIIQTSLIGFSLLMLGFAYYIWNNPQFLGG